MLNRAGIKADNGGALASGALNAYLAPAQDIALTLSRAVPVIAPDAAAQKEAGAESFTPAGLFLWNLTPTQCVPVSSISALLVSLFSPAVIRPPFKKYRLERRSAPL
jgi:hypothetical protein